MDLSTIKNVEHLPEYRSDVAPIESKKLEELGLKAAARLRELRFTTNREMWEAERELDFNSYHLVAPKKNLPYAGYPNLACPLPRIGIDTFHANVMFTFAGQSGKFTVSPDYMSRSHIDVADRAAKYMTHVLNQESDLFSALDKADHDAETYGTGYLMPVYVKEECWVTREVEEEEVVPEIDPLSGQVTRKTVTRRKTVREKETKFDGVKVKRIKPECVFASPIFEDIDDAVRQDYLFVVQSYRFRQLESMSKGSGKNHPPFLDPRKVQELKEYKGRVTASNFEKNKQSYDGIQVQMAVDLMDVEIAEAHFWEDLNGDGVAEKVTLFFEVESGLVLRANYSECRIVKLCPRPVEGRWDGESIRRATAPMVLEWEAIHNQRVAKGQWANLPFFFYQSGGRFNPQMITLMPGKGYPIDNPQAVNFPQMPHVDMSYFQEEKLITDYVERVLALSDSIQGVTVSDETATATLNAQQKAGIRLSTPINRIGKALNKLVGHIWELNKQCAPKLKEFKVAGVGNGVPVFEKMTRQDYDVKVDFRLEMATLHDVQMLRDTALLNYRTFIANPLIMQHPAAFYQLTKNTMKAVGLELDIPKPEQANVRSPFMEHDMIRAGEDLEPVLGEDTKEHVTAHDALIKSEEFQSWPPDAQQRLILHRDKTLIQQQMLQSANLNQSGIFPGMGPMGGGDQPPVTANRNPSQMFNTMKVGESSKSQQKNVSNGSGNGANY